MIQAHRTPATSMLAFVFTVALSAAVVPLAALIPAHAADETLWQALKDRTAFAIMRHATAPGNGDPASMKIGDCATQRNLSAAGRDEARVIGDTFRAKGIARAHVYSSQWCRCRETASALALGPVQELPALNSVFSNADRRAPQTAELTAWLATAPSDQPLILVTHQTNIQALTGQSTSSGQILVARRAPDGTIKVLGSL